MLNCHAHGPFVGQEIRLPTRIPLAQALHRDPLYTFLSSSTLQNPIQVSSLSPLGSLAGTSPETRNDPFSLIV